MLACLQAPAQAQNLKDSLTEAKSDIVVKVYSKPNISDIILALLSLYILRGDFLFNVVIYGKFLLLYYRLVSAKDLALLLRHVLLVLVKRMALWGRCGRLFPRVILCCC